MDQAQAEQDTNLSDKDHEIEAIKEQYGKLTSGAKASLRRAQTPEELLKIPAFYTFLNGRHKKAMLRVMFILPRLENFSDKRKLTVGEALAKSDPQAIKDLTDTKLTSTGMRIARLDRYNWPDDIIQFRRLLIQLQSSSNKQPFRCNWIQMFKTLDNWNSPKFPKKQRMIEDYFAYKYAPPKKDKTDE